MALAVDRRRPAVRGRLGLRPRRRGRRPTLFALVVLFGARSAEARRAGRGTAAMAYGALAAVLSFAAFGGLVVYAVHIMLVEGLAHGGAERDRAVAARPPRAAGGRA